MNRRQFVCLTTAALASRALTARGPLLYVGRDMKTSHKGMGIDESDWRIFVGHVDATLENFKVPAAERDAVLAFVDSTKRDIVE